MIKTLAYKLTESVKLSLNKLIDDTSTTSSLYGSGGKSLGINLNYTIVGDPIFTKDYMVIPIDGTFYTQGGAKLSPYPLDMPTHILDNKIAQVWVSEYSFDTCVRAWHQKGLINESMEIETKYV